MYLINCWIEHPVLKIDQTYSYYSQHSNITTGMRVWIPFGHRKVIGFVDSVEFYETLEELEKAVGFSCKEVVDIVDDEPLLTDELMSLAKKMADDAIAPRISCFKAVLPSKLKPSHRAKKNVMEKWVKVRDGSLETLTSKQEVAMKWLINQGEVKYSQFLKEFKTIPQVLIKKGKVVQFEKEKTAEFSDIETTTKPLKLSENQESAKRNILTSEKKIHLLHGVTGSGKTEVYLQIAAETINEGKQVLILVPEISLTPQMVHRVKSRFGKDVAIYHSGLNDQEKYEQYQAVKRNRVSIVVGTRSAVFMPFQNLGLIVVDEEHDSSYKQSSTPSYHCRDIAIERSKYWGCKVVLGSATPSLESYARAIKNVYNLVELHQRINQSTPQIEIVDLKENLKKGNTEILTSRLKEEIEKCLKNKKQVILLLNRRGYHTALKCNHCQEVLLCKHCDVALNYHHRDKKIKCHSCSSEYDVPKQCPACKQSKGFSGLGYGTQKVEEELKSFFPTAKIERMDADTTRIKNGHQKILKKFENMEIDILLGTQMIAKGLDYPNVTLVGILNADAGLNRLDYRSVEATFDLMVQASGRSGRSDHEGKVILQVFNKDHYAVKCAVKNDYTSFFKKEMKYRHIGQYPPYTYLISILFQGKDINHVRSMAFKAQEKICGDFKVLGPSELNRLKDYYRFRLLIKGKNLKEMQQIASKVIYELVQETSISITVDVNPLILE